MAKFSVGRLEEGGASSSSNRNSKRQRRTRHPPQINEIPEQQQQQTETHEVDDCDDDFQFFNFNEDEDEEQEGEGEGEEEKEEIVNYGGNREKADLVGPSRNGSFSATVTDPEVFDCPICCEPLTAPVFQCENGHIACSTCCTKIMNKCPSCCMPIGYNRCRAIEKVLDFVEVKCRNTKYGCKETTSYGKKHVHEKSCSHTPCYCPISDCNYVGSANHLYKHFSAKHKNSAVHFPYNGVVQVTLNVNNRFIVLQEEGDGVLFILNNRSESLGHVISVSCIAPSWKGGFFYDILARPAGSSVRFQSFTKNIQNQVDKPSSTGFLLVPIESFGTSGDLKLDVYIWQPDISPRHVKRGVV